MTKSSKTGAQAFEQPDKKIMTRNNETQNDAESNRETTDATTRVRRGLTRRQFVKGAGASAALAATGAGSAVAQDTTTDGAEFMSGREGLNWNSEYVQNPYYAALLTKDKHRVEWGTDDTALMAYENDDGDRADLGGEVDRDDTENVVTARADRIAFSDADAFPRGVQYDESGDGDEETEVSALDATHWSSTDSASGTISVADAGSDVNSLQISTSGVASGETATATFDLSTWGAELSSDEAKRFLQLVANVDALASGASVTIAVVDSDGDRKEVYADASMDGGAANVFATGTVNGAVLQQRLGDLATTANGDGTFATITKVVVEVSDADADVTFSALNAEKMSRWVYGSRLVSEDTDDEERTKWHEPSGEFEVTGLDTFSSAFDSEEAVFYDLQYPVRLTLEKGNLDHEYRFVEATDRVGYSWVLEQRAKVELPTGYDLSWSSPALKDDVGVPSSRYTLVQTASGVEDVEFEDIDDSSFTEFTGDYDSQGNTVTLEDPAQTGVVVGYQAHTLLTESNRETVEQEIDSESGGGGAGGRGRDGGDSGLKSWLMAAVAAVGTFLGGAAKGWW